MVKSGFTPAEDQCHDALMLAFSLFLELPREHPDEVRDFVDAVHKIQGLMSTRIVRRDYPDYWPTYSVKPEEKKDAEDNREASTEEASSEVQRTSREDEDGQGQGTS